MHFGQQTYSQYCVGDVSCTDVLNMIHRRHLECTPSATRDFSCAHFRRSVFSTNPKRVWVSDTRERRRTYCNIFCIINFHLHLPIKSSNQKKEKEKKDRDESRRVSDRRSSVHEPRTVEVALLIIGIINHIREKKARKKKPHNTMGEKNLIIRCFAWQLLFFSLLSVIGLFSSSSPVPKLFKTSVCTTETCTLDYQEEIKTDYINEFQK